MGTLLQGMKCSLHCEDVLSEVNITVKPSFSMRTLFWLRLWSSPALTSTTKLDEYSDTQSWDAQAVVSVALVSVFHTLVLRKDPTLPAVDSARCEKLGVFCPLWVWPVL